MHKARFWVLGMLCLPLAIGQLGCGGGTPGGGGGGTTGGEEFRVSFDAEGGNYAVAEDEDGNQYTFRANDDDEITEANVLLADGTVMKASLDDQGRPVKLRGGDNANADIVYDDDGSALVRYTDADGNVEDASGIDTTGAKARVQQRRMANRAKSSAHSQGRSDQIERLLAGLEGFEEIIESIFEDDDSPLVGTSLADAARLIGRLASLADDDIGEEVDLEDVDFDEIPEAVLALAGNTYILFEAEGLCVAETGIENILTFDSNGILLTEFDHNLVFPDFSLGGVNPGFTINYQARTPVNLTPGNTDIDFSASVTPVFTGTQLDEDGKITIERRFVVDIEFEVAMFTQSTAQTAQLFNAAFINGELIDNVLEFNLVLVDLEDESPVEQFGRLRYYLQNSVLPTERDFPCTVQTGEDGIGGPGINCPGQAQPFEAFTIEFDARGRTAGAGVADANVDGLDFDWFVSGGFGYVEDPFSPVTTVVATGEGVLEINLIVSNPTEPSVFDLYYCEVRVGDITASVEGLSCPLEMDVGMPGFFSLSGGGGANVDWIEWYVFGTPAFFVDDPFSHQTDVTFFEPGRFEVWVTAYKTDGTEEHFVCEPNVGGAGFDECEVNRWYGDGICDPFCLRPDPDCGDGDWCSQLGWYGDGFCDRDCPNPDPDCDNFFDECAEFGWYSDGECDPWCPAPDPDCFFDECAEFGWYGDGVCDMFCPAPDPDCMEDWCEVNGWYGDGMCDFGCPRPDPDCHDSDWCEDFGMYGDGWCDFDCPRPDPDCTGDWCEDMDLYSNGWCDPDCPHPDPDCTGDWCEESGFYGDGWCDFECPRPDPDCTGDWCEDMGLYNNGWCDPDCPHPDPECTGDWCEEMGYYGDGWCDFNCPRPDPDCGTADWCEGMGYYGDGWCDFDCPHPDPDCTGDWCEEMGYYGDGWCDFDCPMLDPDCAGGDWCADMGYYADGWCDFDCPMPDPDCEGSDWCADMGYYGDGWCDFDCPMLDPDCEDECVINGWYGDGACDAFCPLPDQDCDAAGDICADNGWYGDYMCDECPSPDPDCSDDCVINGWYWDAVCDEFCPLPDPDCTGFDECAEFGFYGDYACDTFCLLPDPDCSDDCVINLWYWDGVCDASCPLPDPDCQG